MSNIPRARMILAAQYDSIKLHALAATVLLGKYDNKPEIKAVLAALNAPYTAQEAVTWLSKDDAQLALFKAIKAIKLGNQTDDKLILANLREAGLWIGRYEAAPVAAAPEGFVLVPVEPTGEMFDAGLEAGNGHDWTGPSVVWSAMLAARPQ